MSCHYYQKYSDEMIWDTLVLDSIYKLDPILIILSSIYKDLPVLNLINKIILLDQSINFLMKLLGFLTCCFVSCQLISLVISKINY